MSDKAKTSDKGQPDIVPAVPAFTLDKVTEPCLRDVATYLTRSAEPYMTPAARDDLAVLISRHPTIDKTFTHIAYERGMAQGRDDGRADLVESPRTRADYMKNAVHTGLCGLFTPVRAPVANVVFIDKADWTKGYTWTAPFNPRLPLTDPSIARYVFKPGCVTLVDPKHVVALQAALGMSVAEVAKPVRVAADPMNPSADPIAEWRPFFYSPKREPDAATE
jgi:hypothetical protein